MWRYRESCPRDGQTFHNYVGYVKKAFCYLDQTKSWETKDVGNVFAALKLLGKGLFRAPNCICVDIVPQLREQEAGVGAFLQMAFVSFLLAMRVPSEALRPVDPFVMMKSKASRRWETNPSSPSAVPRRTFGWPSACVLARIYLRAALCRAPAPGPCPNH